LKGIVIKSTGSWYHLLTEDGITYQARIRGKFRIANIKHTNPIAVGDEVEFEIQFEFEFGGFLLITHTYIYIYICRRKCSLYLSNRSVPRSLCSVLYQDLGFDSHT